MMLAHTSSIEGSAPHVLQSVLLVLPTNSLLAQSYTNTNSLDSHVIFHTELESNWSSCLMTLIGHSSPVMVVAPSPDGGLLASASSDKTIKLWDPHTGEHLRMLQGHSDWVRSVEFSPDGGLLASASSDKTIKLCDPHTEEHLRTLQGDFHWVRSVAFSPDGGLLASASSDKTIKLWNPHTGEQLRTLQGHSNWVTSVAFSSDGGPLASASPDSLRPMTSSLCVYSEDRQGHTLIHDAYTGQLVQTQSEISFPVVGDQNFLTLENHWVCHGVAHIFHLPSSFSIITWKQRGSLIYFGSQAGQVLILDISNAINTLSMM